MNSQSGVKMPVIIGEVLFDCFPDGTSVLGGAPFNVAWHLHGFGLSPLMLSAVGNDQHGARVQEIMQTWGMRVDGLQVINGYPTGQVVVSIENGEPSYEIRDNQAYDNIDAEQALSRIVGDDFALIYHGTLLQRTEHSRKLIHQLRQQTTLPSFVDVNLRSPWWTPQNLHASLENAEWVKLNNHELLIVMNQENTSNADLPSLAMQLCEQYKLQLLVVTLGEEGAFCVAQNGIIQGQPVHAQVVDTVGAGDAFSSVMIMGLVKGWSVEVILPRALQFAAKICEQRGATTINSSLYNEYLAKWQ